MLSITFKVIKLVANRSLNIKIKIVFFISVKGRECTTHEECAAIENSSCVRDPDDYKMRCLCGNDNPPNNGLCPDVVKGNDSTNCNYVNILDKKFTYFRVAVVSM